MKLYIIGLFIYLLIYFAGYLTRKKENQADSKEVRVLSQTRRVHAEVSFAESFYVSSYHLIKCAAPSPGN